MIVSFTLIQVSEYNKIIVIESDNEDLERVVKERAETLQREDDKEEITRRKIQIYNENTRPMNDSLGDSDKIVKVQSVSLRLLRRPAIGVQSLRSS